MRAHMVMLLAMLLSTPKGGQGDDSKVRGRVCDSVDARNSAESLIIALQDCKVVEGYVHIQLIDLGNDTELEKLSFPELREITHHLMLYRVNGIRSLSQLFPNLAVIRGVSLFYGNYALVVYEMFGLQDVALPSLVVIARGGVLLEKNPSLCYVDTVDWSKLVKDQSLGENGVRLREGRMMPCPHNCPARCGTGGCWSEQYCQHSQCPARCGEAPCFLHPKHKKTESELERLECCHEQCLGGCVGPGPRQCYLCLNVMHEQTCLPQCPPGYVTFHSSRCITRDDCGQLGYHNELSDYEEPSRPWRVFNGSCIPSCPLGYEEHEVSDEEGRMQTCRPCGKEGCRKTCMSNKIDTITKAYNLKGCTHINTSLEIQISGGKDISQELEECLGAIEVIDGYLKISRSFPLLSLNFLRSLRLIRGHTLELGKYSLAVMDNQNLQELWTWSTRINSKLTLANGSIFFHMNPKLCVREIQKLEMAAGLKPGSITEHDVSSLTNGDEVECIVVDLQARVIKKVLSGVLLEWEVLSIPKHDTLLGYLIYSIEAPEQNVTAYDGLDACGGNDWRVDDVSSSATFDDDSHSDHGHTQTQIITRLKPNTQYAFYVKTYSLTTLSRYGGQSPIQYFTTLPSRPSPPINLRASSNHHNELLLQWGRPLHVNGNLSHYLVLGQLIADDQEFLLQQRDYCLHPMTSEEGEDSQQHRAPSRRQAPCCPKHRATPVSQASTSVSLSMVTSSHSEDCSVRCAALQQQQQNSERVESNYEDCFTSFLHELPYQQQQNYTENLAAQETFPQDEALDEKRRNESRDPTVRENVTAHGVLLQFSYVVPAHLSSVLATPLRHYGLYSIQVWACREADPEEDSNAERCSAASQVSLRTAPQRVSDLVTLVNATVLDQSGVRLHWSPPAHPNGLVLAFHVEWRREGQGSFRPLVECLSVPNFRAAEGSYVLGNLPAGTYSMRIRTMSLAGDGPFSDRTSFVIPSLVEANTLERNILLTVLVLCGLLCLAIIFGVIWWRQRHHKLEAEDMCLIASVNPDYVSANYTEDEWELVRNRVTLIRELGQGSFGMVYEGELAPEGSGAPVPCAIKTMNESANCRERLQFLHEASVMKAFTANHVVRLLGVVSRGQPTLVVMELMARGDLKTYLRSERDTGEPSPKRILHMAAQIADGMLYLSTKKFVHRDLAARNCMVSQDLTVKIGDFGMTRDIYETDYYRKGSKGLLPVRWMAPESLQDGVFTSSSDVWSYGVVLWEMSTHAEQPYQGFSNEQVLQKILSGESLSPPSECPAVLAHMMQACWQQVPLQRPSFAVLLEQLLPLVSAEFSQFSFYHSRSSSEPTSRSRQNGNAAHLPP